MKEAVQPSSQDVGALEEPYDGMGKLDMLMGPEVEIGLGPRLVYIWDRQRHQVPITETVTVGRSQLSDIRIPASVISRQHFQLEPTDNGVLLHDVGAINPCRVNGNPVDKQIQLTFGDLIDICGIYFLYVE